MRDKVYQKKKEKYRAFINWFDELEHYVYEVFDEFKSKGKASIREIRRLLNKPKGEEITYEDIMEVYPEIENEATDRAFDYIFYEMDLNFKDWLREVVEERGIKYVWMVFLKDDVIEKEYKINILQDSYLDYKRTPFHGGTDLVEQLFNDDYEWIEFYATDDEFVIKAGSNELIFSVKKPKF